LSIMPRAPVILSSAPPARAYKLDIDGTDGQAQHNGNHNVISQLPDFLSPSKGKKKKSNSANAKRRKGGSRPSTKEGVDDQTPRPTVLERRKNPQLTADAEQQVREFQSLAHRLLELRQEEHQTISRELHDNIAQVLSAVTTRITLAEGEFMPAWLRQELHDLRDHIKGALADVRTLARELRPSVIDHSGFAAALEKHADAFRERTRMTLEVSIVPESISFLGNGDLAHLFRLTQEALQNIEEHSGANHAWINLSERDGAAHLEIGDDGRAFTPERVVEAQQDGHLGLLGMRERAELLGGDFLLEAVPDQGTVIRVTIPPPEQNPNPKHSGKPGYQI
jgi:signal transduction histidine kinase